MMNPLIISDQKIRMLSVVLFAVYFFIGLKIYTDYGFSWDEETSHTNGIVAYKYIGSVFHIDAITSDTSLKLVPDFHEWKDADYGVAFELATVFVEKIFQITDVRDVYLMRHLLNFLVFFVSVIFFFKLIYDRTKSNLYALLGSAMLVLSPRIFADSFYNSKDIIFLSVFIIAVYFNFRLFDKLTVKNAVVAGLFTALAIVIRILGIILPFLFIFFFVVNAWQSGIFKKYISENVKALVAFSISTMIFTYLLYPYLWENPVMNLARVFVHMSKFRWYHEMFYMGNMFMSTDIPRHYALVWIAISTPVLYLMLFLTGLLFVLKIMTRNFPKLYSSTNDLKDVFMTSCFFAPLLMVIVLHSVIYDGWRHLYFIYPALIYVALIGFIKIQDFISNKMSKIILKILLLASLFTNLISIIELHPYQGVYFNSLAGNSESISNNFEKDYWGLSYRNGLEYIVKHDQASTIKIKTNGNKFQHYMLLPDDRMRIQYVDSLQDADYFMTEYRFHPQPYNYPKEFYSVYAGDLKILSVFKLKQN